MLDHVPADQHQFVHMFFSLQRAACSVNFGWCESETYTDGLSDYSSWAIKTYMYCNNFSAPVQWLSISAPSSFPPGTLPNSSSFPPSFP